MATSKSKSKKTTTTVTVKLQDLTLADMERFEAVSGGVAISALPAIGTRLEDSEGNVRGMSFPAAVVIALHDLHARQTGLEVSIDEIKARKLTDWPVDLDHGDTGPKGEKS